MYFYARDEVIPTTTSKGMVDANKGVSNYGGADHRPPQNADGDAVQPIESPSHTNSIESGQKGMGATIAQEASPKFSCQRASYVLWTHFTTSYSNSTVVVWSIWWALAMAGFLQVK